MAANLKKFFISTVNRDNLRQSVTKCLENCTLISFDKIHRENDTSFQTIMGKIHKFSDVQLTRRRNAMTMKLEILPIDDDMRSSDTERKLIVEIPGNFAAIGEVITTEHILTVTAFKVRKESTGSRYLPCVLEIIPGLSVVQCIRCIDELESESVLPRWRRLSFTKIKSLKSNITCCMYGIVVFFGELKRTYRGSHDYSRVLTITDEDNQKIQCVIFSNKIENYPEIRDGEIVRIDKAMIKLFRGMLQGIVDNPQNILVFSKHINDSMVPRHTDPAPVLTKEDLNRVRELRRFYSVRYSSDFTLSTIDHNVFSFNLHCQVVAHCEVKVDELLYFEVWDGTKPSVVLQKSDFDPDKSDNPLTYNANLYDKYCDYFVGIWIKGDYKDYIVVRSGDFIYLKHLIVKRKNGQETSEPAEVFMTDTSPAENLEIGNPSSALTERLKSVQETTQNGGHSKIYSDDLTGFDAIVKIKLLSESKALGKYPTSTVADVVNHKAPFKFHVTARVVDCYPPLEDLNSFLYYECLKCNIVLSGYDLSDVIPSSTVNKFQYYECLNCASSENSSPNIILNPVLGLKMLLADDTGKVEVIVWNDHAEKFFGGLTIDTLIKDESKKMIITDFTDKIKMESETFVNCCLFSYNTNDGVRFQIYDTYLVH